MAEPDRTAGPAALDAEFVRSFVERWAAAWNAHDAAALTSLCADEIVWDDPALAEVVRGRAAVREYLAGVWSMFPDLAFTLSEPPLVALDGSRAAQVWRMTGTMLGSDPWAGFAPTGKRVDLAGVDLYEFRDGLVAHYRGRYDMAECARQLGLSPPRGGRVEHTMALVQRTAMRLRRTPKRES